MKNTQLYNAAMALVKAAQLVKMVDNDFSVKLLDKAEEYKNQIVIDEEQEKEVLGYAERIKQGLRD